MNTLKGQHTSGTSLRFTYPSRCLGPISSSLSMHCCRSSSFSSRIRTRHFRFESKTSTGPQMFGAVSILSARTLWQTCSDNHALLYPVCSGLRLSVIRTVSPILAVTLGCSRSFGLVLSVSRISEFLLVVQHPHLFADFGGLQKIVLHMFSRQSCRVSSRS